MTLVKNLSKNVCKKDDRFKLVRDDGDGFRIYDYKGLALETYREGGQTYLTIDIWYDTKNLRGMDRVFTHEEWAETAESELTRMFNGVESFYIERLACICDKVIAGVERLTKELENDIPDLEPVAARLCDEVKTGNALLEEAKQMAWWKLDDYEVRDAARAIRRIEKEMDNAKSWRPSSLTRAEAKYTLEHFERCGWVELADDDIDAKDLRKYIDKVKEA